MKILTFAIGGEAGYGIASTGLTFSKAATRSGYQVFNYLEYPSIIRGGHNFFACSFGQDPVRAPYQTLDFLVALNQETINLHLAALAEKAGVIFDSEQKMTIPENLSISKFDIPLTSIARDVGGAPLLRDTVALGATMFLLGGDFKVLEELITEEFQNKGEVVKKENILVAEAGYNFAKSHFPKAALSALKPKKSTGDHMVITGNESAAYGAIASGLQFAAIYPMTPISNILHTLAPLQEEFGFVYKQPEDEISAINMAIGAAFGGARAMTASSGGGFCLMTEGLGLAGMTETPLVVVEGMRGGPSTGMPTWTEQGDLRFVLHGHHSEFPKIVIAPGDAEEIFFTMMEAFNLAEKYQTPVLVLVDKHICECQQSFTPYNYKNFKINRGKFSTKVIPDYQRYALAADGISPRVPAGSGNYFIANSDEHEPVGYSTEDAALRRQQMEKRMTKLSTCEKEDLPQPKLYGPPDAKLTIVGWGSIKGSILEALKELPEVNFLHLTWLSPFPTKAVTDILKKAQKTLIIESNYTGQLRGLIAEKTGIQIENSILKYDGRPFFAEEITAAIKEKI